MPDQTTHRKKMILTTFLLLSTSMALCLFFACGNDKKADAPATRKGGFEQGFDEKRKTIASAEKLMAATFTNDLSAASQQYMLLTGKRPQSFSDFVTNNAIPSGSHYTLSTANLGNRQGCIVRAKIIDCSNSFEHFNVKYTWQVGAKASSSILPKT